MIVFHRQILDTPAYYESGQGKRYRRLVGGIAWPREGEPGCAVVLSEDESEPAHYKVQASLENHNAMELMGGCKGLELEFPVSCWFGNMEDRAMMQLLFEFNRDKKQVNRLHFQGAVQGGEPRNSGYYLPLIIERGKVGKNQIDASVSTKLLDMLGSIRPETHLNRDIAQWPMLAALAYGLSYLLTYGPVFRKPSQAINYGRFAWQL